MTCNRRNATLACASLAFAIAGCSEKQKDPEYLNISELPEMQTEHQLTISYTDDFFFGGVSAVVSDSDERIFVGDREKARIFIFDESGHYQGSFGQQGEGPGEFERVDNIQLSPNEDTLYVHDGYYDDIHVFVNDGNNLKYHMNLMSGS